MTIVVRPIERVCRDLCPSFRRVPVVGGWVVAVSLLVNITVVAFGQQPQHPPSFKTAVTLIPLDVRVLDRHGAPVSDLTQEDFIVTEDGVPQQVRHFERQLFSADTSSPATPLAFAKQPGQEVVSSNRRVFLIVLDRWLWFPNELWGTLPALTRFLRQRLLPQDYVALVAFNRATNFTTDHESVARVIERLDEIHRSAHDSKRPDDFREFWGRKPMSPELQSRLDAAFGIGEGGGRSWPRAAGIEARPLLEQIERNAWTVASAENLATPTMTAADFSHTVPATLGAENHVLNISSGIQLLRYVQGEKHLVYVSNSGIWLPGMDDDASLARLGADARVVIHVVQTGGLSGLPGLKGLEFSMSSKHVAELTGGQAFFAQYPDRALARIDQVTRVGYVLGYYPTNTIFDGRSRRITVKVRRPSGAIVLFRHSYIASKEPPVYDQRAFVVQDRIMAAAQYERAIEDIKVELEARHSGKSVMAEIVVNAAQVSLTKDGDRHYGHLDVAFFCTDGREDLLAEVWQQIDLALSDETYSRLLMEGIRHQAGIPINRRSAVWVKVVVFDFAADRGGSAIARVK